MASSFTLERRTYSFPKENVFVKGNWKDGIFYKGRIYGKDMILKC